MNNYTGILHVDSNAIDSRTPTNKISNFSNYLSSQFYYNDDNFEVALTEIQYTHSWYNIPDLQFIIVYNSKDVPDYLFTVEPGHYSIEELVNVLNHKLYVL